MGLEWVKNKSKIDNYLINNFSLKSNQYSVKSSIETNPNYDVYYVQQKFNNIDVHNAISTMAIKDGEVKTADINDSAVTTAKLAADAVTNAKIADDSIDSEHYVDGSIDTAHVADNAITNAKLADDAVGSGEINSNAITTSKISATTFRLQCFHSRYKLKASICHSRCFNFAY